MKKKYLTLLLLFAVMVFISCRPHDVPFSATQSTLVKDSVVNMAANIAEDVSNNGPRAWLDYFEDSPGLFMANEGQLALHDYSSARTFILTTVVKIIPHIKLRWNSLRIDPLTDKLASIGAGFHEDQTLANGNTLSIDGYFTGTAHFDGRKWKLRNCHWSIKAPGK